LLENKKYFMVRFAMQKDSISKLIFKKEGIGG
jgi:hypothetical protein